MLQVMNALRDSSVPVPRMIHLCEDVSVIGTPFYLMEFVDGVVHVDPALPSVPTDEKPRYFEHSAKVLARIHCTDVESVKLQNFGHRGNYYERQLARLSAVARAQAEFAGALPCK